MYKAIAACLALCLAFLPAVSGQVITCSSCGDCSSQLTSPSPGSTISLDSDLFGSSGDCIYMENISDIILDCNSHYITGNFEAGTVGIHAAESRNITMKNCRITGKETGIYLSNSSGNLIYNHLMNNTVNALVVSGTGNAWNIPLNCSSGANIMGVSCLGGSYWSSPSGEGFSDTCSDLDFDYICDSSYTINTSDTDLLPLTLYSPADTDPPLMGFVYPTPPNSQVLEGQDWAFINATSDENLFNCTLTWNGTNESVSASGSWCGTNKTGLTEGAYLYTFHASDSSNNFNSTETRTLVINLSSASNLSIDSYSVYPPVIFPGDDVLIGVNATPESDIDEIQAEITYPNGSVDQNIVLLNNGQASWLAPVNGTYTVTITAEDIFFSSVNATFNFTVGSPFTLTLNLTDFNSSGLSSDLDVFFSGSNYSVFSDHDSEGRFDLDLVESYYDFLFLAFDDEFEVKLLEVPVNDSFNHSADFLDYEGDDGFDYVYSVETDYPFDDAVIRFYYDGLGFDNESIITPHICEDWNLNDSQCDDDWDEVDEDDFTNNEDDEFLEFEVSGFSAFGFKEASVCGDGVCDPGETTSSCSDDCSCDSGDTRSCNVENQGICAVGTETCVNGEWTGCPSASSETCNREDDNCDGVIDNVDNGFSVSETNCGCYNDNTPQSETCNGIDDDCNGIIDDNSDCCTSGQTRDCGPATTQGACQKGQASCVGGTWGDCSGAIFPTDEVCGDLVDNDCDGETDEGCQLDPCPQGEISSMCLCEGLSRSSGYCCSGFFSVEECAEFPYWYLLVIAGVAILVVLVFLVLKFRGEGKELTWEELMNKYRPGNEPPPGQQSE